MIDVTIGKGKLRGKGVYAARDFKKNEIVIMFNLKPLSSSEYDALPEYERYFIHTESGQIYLYGEPERYVNHSDNPNVKNDHIRRADVAIRNIKKGEAITVNSKKDDIP